ncbi:MAG: hypothetical protein AVDCRST_MAG43-154 [uncultured Thermomicrobiales bacterium]|uniref:Mobile element protein n=1 Tax=uncultured Thermomicrobiales bacterium TaxID=1645740 RepID=A0A6J4U5C9_9BACT|nr:MAG: hypothetical protein AVDCRST_MAG43-154 [uncultured Thermomicrobiales bacterium]
MASLELLDVVARFRSYRRKAYQSAVRRLVSDHAETCPLTEDSIEAMTG